MADSAETGNPYTRGMAAFISGLRFEAIPDTVITRVKLLILDTLGCGIYAADKEHSRIMLSTLRALDHTRNCTVWGTRERLSAPHAALINGAMVQGFEIDDVHMRATVHVGSVSLPTIVALAETRSGIGGRTTLTSAVAAYEIGARVGLCMGNAHLAQGWHAPATQGVFAAAAAAAAILGLSEDKTIHALGIGGTQSAGLMAAQYGSMVKRMNAGRAAQSGLYSGLLAESGFTGIVNVFESNYGGFCTTFSRSHDGYDLSELTSGLGTRFETLNVSLKFYSCAASIHTSLDAVRVLRQKHPFRADQVRKVVIHAAKLTIDHVGFQYHPAGMTSAQMSLQFCMATLLLEGDVFVDQFSEGSFSDPVRIAMAQKVEIVHDPDITAMGTPRRLLVRVDVHMNDGSVLSETAETARGRETRFASETEVVEKFQKLASHALPATRVDQIINTVLNLEKLDDANVLAMLLTR